MRFAAPIAAVALIAGAVSAAPLELEKRQNATAPAGNSTAPAAGGVTDAVILNYALTLEHLENAFYRDGLNKMDANAFKSAGFPEWVRYRLTEIASHEANHVSFLTGALSAAGASPVAECKYSFPYTSPASFLAVAQILEGVGVSAYLGAAASIMNKDYLTAAGSILTVEARHTAWVRGAAQNLDSFPTAYDTPLSINNVYSLASAFITSCPSSNVALPVKAFPAATGTLSGSQVKISTAASGAQFAAVLNGPLPPTFLPCTGNCTITLPKAATGQVYVVLTKANGTVSDDNTVAGPAVVEVPVPATLFAYRK